MAESASIAKMSITHHAILDWLLLNPEKPMRDCAAHFRITQAWLSCVVQSGCFQAELAKARAQIQMHVTQELPMRLQGVAHVALDRIAQHMETSTDADFALKALDTAMKGLGAGKANVSLNFNQQNNVQQLFATPADLAKARALINGSSSGVSLPPPKAQALPVPQQDFFEGGSICEAVQAEPSEPSALSALSSLAKLVMAEPAADAQDSNS